MLPPAKGTTVPIVLVGTVSGVYAAAAPVSSPRAWTRLGGCSALPLVLVAGLSYEPTTDTVVAATMGRGVYILPGATERVRDAVGL